MGAEASVHNKLGEVGGLRKVTDGDLMRSWVDGYKERMWKPSLRIRLDGRGPDDK